MPSKTRTPRSGILAPLTVIALAIGLTSYSAHAQVTPVGGIARNFTITNHMTGGPLRLYDLEGKIILLDFWAYWCSYCRTAAADIKPNIVEYYRTNGGNPFGLPVEVLSINIDFDDPAATDNYIQTYGLELVGDDYLGEAWSQFPGSGIPHFVLINGITNSTNYQPWEVLYIRSGYNQGAIKTKIDSVQASPPVCVMKGPALGSTNTPPVILAANVISNSHIIKRVEFHNGGLLIGAVSNAPYNYHWNAASAGEKSVTARAWYGAGLCGPVSEPATFFISPAPPNILQHPLGRTILYGGSNSLTVVAAGSEPLGYQWQKNELNLQNGGHYSGCTTPTLVVVNCDANDQASYRCVVNNPYGTNFSNPALLAVTSSPQPPRIVQQPCNQSVAPGGTTTFFLVAAGSEPLGYQWEKNSVNLHDDGHCLGTATDTLTITGASSSDAANYRCIVTNEFGSTNSDTVALGLAGLIGCATISNADFEMGFSVVGGGYLGNNWLEWETDAGGVTGYDALDIKRSGAHAQRIRVSGGLYGTSGGVYQRVPVVAGTSYTVGVWIYAGDPFTSCSLGVHPGGGTNAASNVTWSTPTTNVAWVPRTVTVTATSSHLTIFYKVASTDSVKRNGYFDDGTPVGSNGPLRLGLCREPGNLTLTWPQCPSSRLEWANSLSGTNWTIATNLITTLDGNQQLELPSLPQSGSRFFRLVREQ